MTIAFIFNTLMQYKSNVKKIEYSIPNINSLLPFIWFGFNHTNQGPTEHTQHTQRGCMPLVKTHTQT